MDRQNTGTDRGQAFTLEGMVSAMIVLTAVLFALQAVVLMPTSGGSGDRATMLQDERELKDALIVSATNETENLSWTVRNWNTTSERYENASPVASVPEGHYANASAMDGTLGRIMAGGMAGDAYSVELYYTNESGGQDVERLIYQPSASASDVTASFTVTLFNQSNLTAPGHESITLEEAYEDHDFPIDPHPDLTGEEVYNVVEVRVTWQR